MLEEPSIDLHQLITRLLNSRDTDNIVIVVERDRIKTMAADSIIAKEEKKQSMVAIIEKINHLNAP